MFCTARRLENYEEENPFWLATLRSRVMIVPAWAATHPSPDVLKRVLSPRIYPERRDIFVKLFRDATKTATVARAAQVASTASTTATPGTATNLQNSQCALNVAAMTVTSNGDTLILTLPMTFESAYAGTKNIYLSASDLSGAKSGSQK
jgi:hypothetical protein